MTIKTKNNTTKSKISLNDQLMLSLEKRQLSKTFELIKNGANIHDEEVYEEVERLIQEGELYFIYALIHNKILNFYKILSESPSYSYELFDFLIKMAKSLEYKSTAYKRALENVMINAYDGLEFNKVARKKKVQSFYKSTFDSIIEVAQKEYQVKFGKKFDYKST